MPLVPVRLRDKLKKSICFIFSHEFEINSNENDLWLQCKVCQEQKNIPDERLDEAYLKLSVFKGDLSWKE